VDDSTLTENTPDYLERHLLSVISELASEANIRLAAVGIGHDVTRYYPDGIMIQAPTDLGHALVGQIKGLILSVKAEASEA